jgi:hypothetical protein
VLKCETLDAALVVRVSGESRKQAPADDFFKNAISRGDGAPLFYATSTQPCILVPRIIDI